ncbi:MAG: hypothetical protein U0U69_16645 [Acidimicrobiia bacterium]
MSHLIGLTWAVPAPTTAVSALERIGFDIDTPDVLTVGEVVFELVPAGSDGAGLRAWAFGGDSDETVRFDPTTLPPTELRTRRSARRQAAHPNGVHKLDHVVAMVPRLETSVAGLEEYVGADCRRRGEVRGLPAAFLRAGEVVLELVEMRTLAGPRLWGAAFATDDCDKTVAVIRERGGDVTEPDRAVQGGRIAQCPGDILGATVAFLEPAR